MSDTLHCRPTVVLVIHAVIDREILAWIHGKIDTKDLPNDLNDLSMAGGVWMTIGPVDYYQLVLPRTIPSKIDQALFDLEKDQSCSNQSDFLSGLRSSAYSLPC